MHFNKNYFLMAILFVIAACIGGNIERKRGKRAGSLSPSSTDQGGGSPPPRTPPSKSKYYDPRLSEKIKNMVVFGDSIMVGFLSEGKGTGEKAKSTVSQDVLKLLSNAVLAEKNKYGEKTLTKIDKFYKKKGTSALVGNQSKFCFAHSCIIDLGPEKAWNLAESGAKIEGAMKQVKEFEEKNRELKEKYPKLKEKHINGRADYTVVGVGANDICASGFKFDDTTNITSNYHNLVVKIAGLEEAAKSVNKPVIFLGIPRIDKVSSYLEDDKETIKSIIFSTTCKRLRSLGCPNFEYLRNNGHKIQELNKKLKEEVEKKADELATARSDSKKELIFMEIDEIPGSTVDLAVDCFHPSKEGQKKISEKVMKKLKEYLDIYPLEYRKPLGGPGAPGTTPGSTPPSGPGGPGTSP